MPLVDTLEEQAVLEAVLDAGKPVVPLDARHLHYLIYTPFRYPPAAEGSRFRGPQDIGVFYGAEAIRTACAELGFWRWRFLQDSPALPRIDARAQTLFQVSVKTDGVALDTPPFVDDGARWTDPNQHDECQAFGRTAREAAIGLIRYTSARDPVHGACAAILTPRLRRARAARHHHLDAHRTPRPRDVATRRPAATRQFRVRRCLVGCPTAAHKRKPFHALNQLPRATI
jgi:hypothetical protein